MDNIVQIVYTMIVYSLMTICIAQALNKVDLNAKDVILGMHKMLCDQLTFPSVHW